MFVFCEAALKNPNMAPSLKATEKRSGLKLSVRAPIYFKNKTQKAQNPEQKIKKIKVHLQAF